MSTRAARPRRRSREYRGPARSCEQCFSWGVLRGRLCRGCENFASKNAIGPCRTCGRVVPVSIEVCRLCRKQASLVAGPDNKITLDLSVAAVTGQQLFFANMQRALRRHPSPVPVVAPELEKQPILSAVSPSTALPQQTQGLLFDPARDCRHSSSRDPARDPRFLDLVLRRAGELAEHRGWPPRTLLQVRRGLRMLASCHDPGEPIKASTVMAMSPVGVPGLRVLEVLTCLDGDVVVEDRPDSLTIWVDEQVRDLPPQMHQEVHAWIMLLRNGSPRRRALHRSTVSARLASIRPFLLVCATRYTTLRQVTRHDVIEWLEGRKYQANDASALRNLFRTLKSERLVFTNPTSRIRVGAPHQSAPSSLSLQSLRQLGDAAECNPALRVVLALIGVHALLPNQVRRLHTEHLDLPNQRLHTGTVDRAMDPFTASAIADYLAYRHERWPHSSNQYLLLTRRTAHEQGPVSHYWLSSMFRGLPVTLRQLREDRILEEARAAGGDPLHLAAMFGMGAKAGLRYASAVHPERNHPGG